MNGMYLNKAVSEVQTFVKGGKGILLEYQLKKL